LAVPIFLFFARKTARTVPAALTLQPALAAVMAPYRTPNALSDVRVLDLIELSGSTVRAAPLLNMSQPSVSRRRRRLAAELGLVSTSQLRQGDGACLGGCCAGRPNATASMLVCGAWAVMAGVWTLAWLMPQRWCRPSALYRCSSGKPWSAAMNYRMRSLICSPSDRRWPASKGLHERVAVHSGLPQNAGKGADGNASAPTRTLITVSSIAWSQPVRSTSGRWR
jgi:hypothetical protein